MKGNLNLDSDVAVVGAESNFDLGKLTSAISAIERLLDQLASTFRQVVRLVVKAADGIRSLIDLFYREEHFALQSWESEGGSFGSGSLQLRCSSLF